MEERERVLKFPDLISSFFDQRVKSLLGRIKTFFFSFRDDNLSAFSRPEKRDREPFVSREMTQPDYFFLVFFLR